MGCKDLGGAASNVAHHGDDRRTKQTLYGVAGTTRGGVAPRCAWVRGRRGSSRPDAGAAPGPLAGSPGVSRSGATVDLYLSRGAQRGADLEAYPEKLPAAGGPF